MLKLFRRLESGDQPRPRGRRGSSRRRASRTSPRWRASSSTGRPKASPTAVAIAQRVHPERGRRLGAHARSARRVPATVPLADRRARRAVARRVPARCSPSRRASRRSWPASMIEPLPRHRRGCSAQRTAELHLALARATGRPRLRAASRSRPMDQRSLYQSLRNQAPADVPARRRRRHRLPADVRPAAARGAGRRGRRSTSAAATCSRSDSTGQRIRVHGDYHPARCSTPAATWSSSTSRASRPDRSASAAAAARRSWTSRG